MSESRTLSLWLAKLDINVAQLVATTGLESRVIEAIVAGRYTTSPEQRAQIASALGVGVDEVQWGRAIDVQSMYGHGPQFGRSP